MCQNEGRAHQQHRTAHCRSRCRVFAATHSAVPCRFWDWRSGNCFQQGQTVPQPGSLDSEAGIYALAFDRSGSRLVTCEADKSIKMWKEDSSATEESHPVQFRPPKDLVRRY